MEKLYIFIIGFSLGFFICVLMMESYHKRIAKRGHMISDDKLYEVRLKGN